MELLLNKEEHRYVIYPIQYNDIWSHYKNLLAVHWVAEEVDMSEDINDWDNRLTENEKLYIKSVLAFFAASDGIVNENLAQNMMNDIQLAEAKCYYGFQIAQENVHSEMYSLMIDAYIKDSKEKAFLFNALETMPIVKEKANWAFKYIENGTFVQRLVAFMIVEGLFFSSSFCSIFYMRSRGLLPGLCKANDFISRDEAMHCQFAQLLYNNYVKHKLSSEEVIEMFKEAVEIEKKFVQESIPVSLLGLNSSLMCQYVEYVADNLLVSINLNKIYNSSNPFSFMKSIAIEKKTNFFERRVSEYNKADTGKGIVFDADF